MISLAKFKEVTQVDSPILDHASQNNIHELSLPEENKQTLYPKSNL